MTTGSFGGDLMAGPPPTRLPADPADAALAGGEQRSEEHTSELQSH